MHEEVTPTTRVKYNGRTISLEADSGDLRDPFERDCDILLYSSALRRLKGVTQVQPIVNGVARGHDRFIHSLKVAQVGKRIAQRLIAKNRGHSEHILPEAVYFAGLAHDLGHPPFGHVAERELHSLLVSPKNMDDILIDGFEGNAQTLRILVRSSQKTSRNAGTSSRRLERGLGLTVGSLVAVMKYPWSRFDSQFDLAKLGKMLAEQPEQKKYHLKKWGVYDDDVDVWHTIRDSFLCANPQYVINSQIMDLADDITYAIHDIADYYRQGAIPPLSVVFEDQKYTPYAKRMISEKTELYTTDDRAKEAEGWLTAALNVPSLSSIPGLDDRYDDSRLSRSKLHQFESDIVTAVIEEVDIDDNGLLTVDPAVRIALELLKQIMWYYVIEDPALSASQWGQRKVVRELYTGLCEWYDSTRVSDDDSYRHAKENDHHRRLPRRFVDMVDDLKDSKVRVPRSDGTRPIWKDKSGLEWDDTRLCNIKDPDDRPIAEYECMTSTQQIRRAAADYITSLTDSEAIKLHHHLMAIGSLAPMRLM